MEILKVENLCKTYGTGEAKVEALKQVSFSLCRGSLRRWWGSPAPVRVPCSTASGALDTPTSGHILMDGQDLFAMKDEQRTIFRRRNIGFIFQSFQLIPELNVEQNIQNIRTAPEVSCPRSRALRQMGSQTEHGVPWRRAPRRRQNNINNADFMTLNTLFRLTI